VILDTFGMFDAAAAFPEQLARALDVSRLALEKASLPPLLVRCCTHVAISFACVSLIPISMSIRAR
jgi:hypothetical protein